LDVYSVWQILPKDAPEPLGKHVTLSHYVDANLMHDVTTGISVTGILHLINKTLLDWYSKKQVKVETATYGFTVEILNGPLPICTNTLQHVYA
jgi:hypothetical protein